MNRSGKPTFLFSSMRYIITFLALLSLNNLLAQTSIVRGTVSDNVSESYIPGAFVQLGNNKTVADDNGNFMFQDIPYGTYEFIATSFDYDTLRLKIVVKSKETVVNPKLGGTTEIEEIKVTANISTDRKTPIAITKITAEKIAEELGSRDLPMILNATPGVFATQSGGGDGDARITIRGFDQRNIGVLIDGVPVNDMENGAVYWSNWFGLDAITNQIQVQRGLGATKLSMPSVGGSLNIVTQGMHSRKGFTFKQEFATGNFIRSSISYNSGRTKKGWGFSFSGSYKQGDGWVEGTNTQGGFYYAKVQKIIKKHLISLSAFGAPQKHGQRSYYQPIQYWDTAYATKLNVPIDTLAIMDKGIRFNQHWGFKTNEDGKKVILNERLNYYHKPQITLKDFWTVNKKISISNIAYMSIGRGGGTRLSNSSGILYTKDGHINWDEIIKSNQVNPFFGGPNVDLAYSPTELKSSQVLISSVNNHFWVGYLGQIQYQINSKWNFSGGLDYRFYKGSHYQEITDLLGGDYFISTSNANAASPMMRKGDKIALKTYNNDRNGFVQWGGLFSSVEYSGSRWTAFLNVSGVVNSYKGVDYFRKKVLDLGDTVLNIGANDTIQYQGNTYTASSKGLEYNSTEWKSIPGGTVKGGVSFIINENSKVFANLGYLSRTPQFSNVIDNNTNKFFKEIKNEVIQAIELGYTFANKFVAVDVNGYFTNWKNKPFPNGVAVPDPDDPTSMIYLNINGMDAIHYGGEVAVSYNILKNLQVEAMFSIGDWRWNSSETFYVPELDYSFTFDAKGVHVGNAAQTMLNASIRYEPIKHLYFKLQYQGFDRYFAEFSPFSLQGANGGREPWKLPTFSLMNAYAGYSLKINKVTMFTNVVLSNILNHKYISDANDSYYIPKNFDAQSAAVVFGQGFRFNVSVGISF